MKTVIVGVNAKYIHTALAARSLGYYAQGQGIPDIRVMEFTINQPVSYLLEQLYQARPDVLLLSCYLWNWNICRSLVQQWRLLSPDGYIFLGGPQVSFHAPEILKSLPEADGILYGEGEISVCALLEALKSNTPLDTVPSLCLRRGEEILETPPAPPLDLSRLPFCYPDLGKLRHQIVYYEASRGCPFRCTYCLSGLDRQVRIKPLKQVQEELDRFLLSGVQQVKFCDRTFNCRQGYCDAIWQYLIEHDNGVTNFHFEITAELLREDQLSLLRTARPGLFQFEIGVQSLNPDTLRAIRRPADWERLRRICLALHEAGNIHLHLDLIAGLPLEGYESFSRSFDGVYSLLPDQLQLGFLKCLPGSQMEEDAPRYGIVSRPEPPYEVLVTRDLSAGELFSLSHTEQMVESFYNSGAFSASLGYLLTKSAGPFAFFSGLGEYYAQEGYLLSPPARILLYDILFQYGLKIGADPQVLAALIRFDLCLQGKPKKWPGCLKGSSSPPYPVIRALVESPGFRERHLAEYAELDIPSLMRAIQVESFPLDVTDPSLAPGETLVLFHYRAPRGHRAIRLSSPATDDIP